MLVATLVSAAVAATPAAVDVHVDRRIGTRKVVAVMRAPGFEGRVAIQTRGRWSRHFPKKFYRFEIRDPDGSNRNVPLLGMPADDDWILYAAYDDRTLMRNVLAYDTARWMGRYASRTRFVELRLNGEYRGVYVLMEKLKLHKDRVRGDFLLEKTSRRQALRKDPSFLSPVTRRPYIWEDPERKDLRRREALRIRAAVDRAERALYLGRPGAWRRHLHAGAAVDFLLVNELFKNQDAMGPSTYLSARHGRALQLGPVWDFDMAMGAPRRQPWRVHTGWISATRPWAVRLYADRAFARSMARRWGQLRRAGLRARASCGRSTRARRRSRRRRGATAPAGRRAASARVARAARTCSGCGSGSSAGSRGWTATCRGSDESFLIATS